MKSGFNCVRVLLVGVLACAALNGCDGGGESANSPSGSECNSWTDTGAWPEPGFASMDNGACSLTGTSVANLADKIRNLSSDELDTTRAIYAWVTHNISYDGNAFKTGVYPSQTAAAVFSSKLGVCAGYANLFKALCDNCGITCSVVSGYAKGFGYTAGSSFSSTNHAWNIVIIDGSRHIIDSTWGSGYLNSDYTFARSVTGFWFCVDPELSIFTHLPQAQGDELLSPPVNMSQFVNEDYTDGIVGLSALYDLGVDQPSMAACLDAGYGIPTAYSESGWNIKLLEIPLQSSLPAGTRATFRVSTSSAYTMYVIDESPAEDWTRLDSTGSHATTITTSGNGVDLVIGPIGGYYYYYFLRYSAR